MLIPLFNYYWQFHLLRAASRGSKGRLAELGAESGDGGLGIGLTYQALVCLAAIIGVFEQSEGSGELLWALRLAGIVAGVAYWVRIARFNRQIEARAGTNVAGSVAA
jgi:hypothetical protein